MTSNDIDRGFAGSIPQIYEEYLVPLIFEPYAMDIAARVGKHHPATVLEIAAGLALSHAGWPLLYHRQPRSLRPI